MIHGTMTISSKKDYLSILGLSNDFDDKELKKAFRKEARKWHPDLNKNDINAEERFKLINEAYEYLSNLKNRNIISDLYSHDEYANNIFKTGFPDFQHFLDSLFGYNSNSENAEEVSNDSFNDESENLDNDNSTTIDNDEFNNCLDILVEFNWRWLIWRGCRIIIIINFVIICIYGFIIK